MSGADTTPLARELAARIARDGPISVAAYIDACLQHPEHGYYRRQAAIGTAADFITAPEISQVFGEIIGLWCAVVWQQLGSPARVRLVELGPGRGTLMGDALRASRLVPAFRAALRVELVESSTTLEAAQRAALANEAVPLTWSRELAPGGEPAIVVANEFLDTLAVEQWVFRGGTWRTRCIDCTAGGALSFADGRPPLCADVPAGLAAPAEGSIFETRGAAFATLTAKLAAVGMPVAGLFIDYGHASPGYGDTLQAVSKHGYADPLARPGEADLTAQVDFAGFAAAVRGAGLVCDGPVPQAEFLGRLGVLERGSRLMAANPGQAAAIEAAIARLMAPVGMGTRFQAIGIRSPDLAPLPALTPVDTAHRTP